MGCNNLQPRTSHVVLKHKNWVVVSNIFYFYPYLVKWSNLTNIFQVGWNHQLVKVSCFAEDPTNNSIGISHPPGGVLDFTGWKVLHGGGGKVDERKQSDGQKETSSNL